MNFKGGEFIVTMNRPGPEALTRFHKIPLKILPIISNKDSALVKLIISSAHEVKSCSPAYHFHLNKQQTMCEIRKNFCGVHINNLSKMVAKFIQQCILCRRMEAKLQTIQISDKWILRHSRGQEGLCSSIGIDIAGPYKYKIGTRETRSTKVGKVWLLFASCQITSACNAVAMENYSVASFMGAFQIHVSQTQRPSRITCDAGSQFRSLANQTRAGKAANESLEDPEGMTAASLVKSVSRKMKNIEFYVAASSAQWQNGLCEGNFRQAKELVNIMLFPLYENNKTLLWRE